MIKYKLHSLNFVLRLECVQPEVNVIGTGVSQREWNQGLLAFLHRYPIYLT